MQFKVVSFSFEEYKIEDFTLFNKKIFNVPQNYRKLHSKIKLTSDWHWDFIIINNIIMHGFKNKIIRWKYNDVYF